MVISWMEQPIVLQAMEKAKRADFEGLCRTIPLIKRLNERATAAVATSFLIDAEVRNLIAQYVARSQGIPYKQAKSDLYELRVSLVKDYRLNPTEIPTFIADDGHTRTLSLPDGVELPLDAPELPEWVEKYRAADQDLGPGGIEWLRQQPGVLQEVLVRFPPMCLVRARRPMQIPAPGEIAFVQAATTLVDGQPVLIVGSGMEPDAPRGECKPADLEYVGAFGRVTPERVAEVLAPEVSQ
jgi:hypothetical protein